MYFILSERHGKRYNKTVIMKWGKRMELIKELPEVFEELRNNEKTPFSR